MTATRSHDDTIHKQSHRSEILQETLMNDKELARLHRQAVAYHRETFQKMARNPAIQTLMADCRAAKELTE
jgi:sulfur relay (sulfurtransferase) DsrC/TusE family protein